MLSTARRPFEIFEIKHCFSNVHKTHLSLILERAPLNIIFEKKNKIRS